MSDASDSGPLSRYSEAEIPTAYGVFRIVIYRHEATGVEHVAMVRGPVEGGVDVLTRVHSECLTGEVFHSLKCDCREQLDLALRRIGEAERGVLIYLRQEGRGIGLGNKIRAYALQARGLDTVDANRALGFDDDPRRYHVASRILEDLKVQSIALLTNNPDKIAALRRDGVLVTRREHQVEPHEFNREYLDTKRVRMGHLGDESTEPGDEDDEELDRLAARGAE